MKVLNNKFFYFLLPVCIALGVLIPCEFNVKFQSAEQWVPKKDIERTIQSFQKIRLIQLMNWPSVRQHILKEFPMIQSMGLSFGSFPKIQINIIEKQPWAIIVHQQKHFIVSKDGTLLNQKLRDVELPDSPNNDDQCFYKHC